MTNQPNLTRRFAFIIDGIVADSISVDDIFAAILSQSPTIVELEDDEVMPGWKYDQLNSTFINPDKGI